VTLRCGKCENCVKLEKVKASVARCANPPFSHADQDVVELWNAELARLPCLGEADDLRLQEETQRLRLGNQ
jgi:hypothetical protein